MKSKMIGIAIAACTVWSFPMQVFAEADPWFNQWRSTVYQNFSETLNDQMDNFNNGLSDIYSYLSESSGDKGNGWVGTMNKIWQEARPYLETGGNQQSSWARTNTNDGVVLSQIAKIAPDIRNCSEMPKKVASRALGGGGGGSSGKGKVEGNIAKVQGGAVASDVASAAMVYKGHGEKYCTPQDALNSGSAKEAYGEAHGSFKCTVKGPMPDADVRVQSIFVPAHDFIAAGDSTDGTQAANIAAASSLTYDAKDGGSAQSDAAEIALGNLVASFSPPGLPKEIAQTPAGRAYEAKVKVFNDRISPAVMALSTIKAQRTSSIISTDAAASAGSVFDNWKSNAEVVYKNVFPIGTPLPKNPSSLELSRFEVFRRYLDWGDKSWLHSIQTGTPDQVIVEDAETLALEAYLGYQKLLATEQRNAIYAGLLAQSVNPLTKQEMFGDWSTAMKNK